MPTNRIPSDIEIAQNARMKPIVEVASSIGIREDELELYGPFKAKVTRGLWERIKDRPDGKLILVTAITPTPAERERQLLQLDWGRDLQPLARSP